MEEKIKQPGSFTGRTRKRATRPGVLVIDRLSRWVITIGGFGVIVAVLGVCVFLLSVVMPLFTGAKIDAPAPLGSLAATRPGAGLVLDDARSLAAIIDPSAHVRLLRLDNGQTRHEVRIFGDRKPTCSSFLASSDQVMFGFEDGTIQLVSISYETSFLTPDQVPASIKDQVKTGSQEQTFDLDQGIVQLTPQGQFRKRTLKIKPLLAAKVSQRPIRLIDHAVFSSGPLALVMAGSAQKPELLLVPAIEDEDLLTGEKSLAFGDPVQLPYQAAGQGMPMRLFMVGTGGAAYIIWADGAVARLDTVDRAKAYIAETGRLAPVGVGLTAISHSLGKNTLIWGDARGAVRGGFLIEGVQSSPGQGLIDGQVDPRSRMVFRFTKDFRTSGPPATVMGPSSRSRIFACGFEDGSVGLYNVTNETELGAMKLPDSKPVRSLVITPKEDALVALSEAGGHIASFDPRYPEATFKGLFLPVWYEGYSEPHHTWQSTGGDAAEAKLGLMPLVFGTIKATFYSMLFGVPVAILAAVFTSEFLHRRTKAIVKPTIELMASLPSVVLGFLAGLVFAQFVEDIVTTILLSFVAIPFAILLGAYLWQTLPVNLSIRYANFRLPAMVLPAALGLLIAVWLGPWVERALFGGDFRAWSSWIAGDPEAERYQSSTGGWMTLLLPLAALLTAWLVSRFITPILRGLSGSMERGRLALFDGGKYLLAAAFALFIAWVLGASMSGLGLDPRQNWMFMGLDLAPVGTYIQRNSLIVGFVMGFAIIPIIYTIAEDALSAVPEHLRSASLGAGATPWQTATRIIIPTAASGLFSATMIGLGRAVGETMIVLMAAGNTPIMQMNLFNGFRSLAANIAVEMPEAVKDSTHYRTLFMAALVLFAMTFLINTVAETVRIRFRKRAFQL